MAESFYYHLKQDIAMSEFGFRHAALCWYKNTGDNKYNNHVLRSLLELCLLKCMILILMANLILMHR